MNKTTSFILGAIVGAAAGLLFAPQTGRRSRALIRDKAVRYSHDGVEFADKKSRHLANKARGYAHEVRDMLAGMAARRETEPEEEAGEA